MGHSLLWLSQMLQVRGCWGNHISAFLRGGFWLCCMCAGMWSELHR